MNTTMTRRQMMGRVAGAAIAVAASPRLVALDTGSNKRLGVSVASYGFRFRGPESEGKLAPFQDAMDMLEHCHSLGAGGIQVGVGRWQSDFAGKIREKRESYGMYLEGQIRLPEDKSDCDRFEEDIRMAKEAGASILRTVMLRGRRYETFESAEEFGRFKRASWNSLELAEPIVRKQKVQLALENHKDWRVPEMLDIMKRISSEHVGVCLDTGNSISLMEEPTAFAEAYAPFVVTTHFKDMAVKEYEDGFLLSEVPLGEGYLDLARIQAVCEKANPKVQFNLEMITRDPLKIPCLTEKYWATMRDVSGWHLAKTLAMVRRAERSGALPAVRGLSPTERMALEEEHVRRSFDYARRELRL